MPHIIVSTTTSSLSHRNTQFFLPLATIEKQRSHLSKTAQQAPPIMSAVAQRRRRQPRLVMGTKCEGRKLMHVTDVQINIMELLNCKYLGEIGYLKSIGV